MSGPAIDLETTLGARREPFVRELRDRLLLLLYRRGSLDIEAPVFPGASYGPCYLSDRTGNSEDVGAHDNDYKIR